MPKLTCTDPECFEDCNCAAQLSRNHPPEPEASDIVDPFTDDTPIEAACDLENPESCESCQ